MLALIRLYPDPDAEVGTKLRRTEVAEDSGRLCQLQSAEVIDYVGVPTLPAIIEAIDALEEIGRRQDIELVLMGGIRDGVDAVKALCLGADAVAFATSAIIAGGCIACMQCHIGQCVTGIATQDPEHESRYDPEAESHNIHRFGALPR